MQVTLFGWVYMPLLLTVAMWARPWLLGLVLGSAVFQATAVVNIPVGAGFYGISPYVASAGVAGCVMLWRRFGPAKSAVWPPPAHIRTPAIWLLVYAAVAVVGSFALPHVFMGLPVQPPLEPYGYSLKEFPPLRWSISNFAQALNLCTHLTVISFIWQSIQHKEWSPRNTLLTFGWFTAIALIAGLHDRGALMMEWPRMTSFWMSNMGYVLVDHVPIYLAHTAPTINGPTFFIVNRISSPFSEPSYGSAFLASVYAGILAVYLFSNANGKLALLALLLSAAGLLNTTGSTGWVTALGATLLLFIVFVWRRLVTSSQDSPRRGSAWRRLLAAIFAIAAVVSALWYSPVGSIAPVIGNAFTFNKVAALKNDDRFLSDMRALELTYKTQGLGTGMGSNRSSSFITSLLSNTGMIGTVAFFAMLGALAWHFMRVAHLTATQHFALAALGACVVAVSLTIPDLNLPFLWTFIFLAFVVCPEPDKLAEPQTGNTR